MFPTSRYTVPLETPPPSTRVELPTGQSIAEDVLPKGTLHAFKNVGMEIATMVVLITPAGMDRFFFEVGRSAFEGGIAPPPGSEDIEKILGASAKYGLEVLPPPEQ